MKKKFAIVLLGHQNSGKTTTIKHFDEMYDEWNRKKKQCRAGWRSLLLFKDALGSSIHVSIFFVPASPTETKYPLEGRMKKIGYAPDLLLIAEQKNGNQLQRTLDWLDANGYEVKTFDVDRNSANACWSGWNDSNTKDILDKRGEAICNSFKEFILKRIC